LTRHRSKECEIFREKCNLSVPIMLAALTLTPACAQEADTALNRIRQNKAVTVGFRESAQPFSYLDENGQASPFHKEPTVPFALHRGWGRRRAAFRRRIF
jgi:ABC-type amino acid transport substrate-binding protein